MDGSDSEEEDDEDSEDDSEAAFTVRMPALSQTSSPITRAADKIANKS